MLNRVLVGLAVVTLTSASAAAEVLIGLAASLTGPMAWLGEQHERAVEIAVAEINDAGGLLGQPVEVVNADDYCDGEQAVAAAHKLVAAGVTVVVGHGCSGAAIPASRVYEAAGIVMISYAATNPKLTDQGFRHIFRMVARDTLQGEMAAAYLAEHRADRRIAILHDGEGYGRGLAAVAEALHAHQFDTVLGRIGFDERGDVTGYETYVWYVWEDGEFAPLEEPAANK